MRYSTPTLPFLLLIAMVHATIQDNCTNTVSLRPDNTCTCAAITSDDLDLNCVTLSQFLLSYNDVIPQDNCLRVSLSPGDYTLTEYDAVLKYSVIITAPEGNVIITCQSDCAPPPNSIDPSSPLVLNATVTVAELFVVLEGLDFQDCPRPLQFDELDSVLITDCTFSNFEASAVDLFNCLNIDIQSSIFSNNTASSRKAQFRGNSGGLSIGYHTNKSSSPLPFIKITDSMFENNKAVLPSLDSSSQQINLALNNHFYFGRGGGLGIFIDESFANVNIEIENCIFTGNYAQSFGGGVYLYVDGDATQHNATIRGSHFYNNSAGPGSFGGGLQVAFLVRNLHSSPSMFDFVNCSFRDNHADFGGGMSTVQVYSQGAGNLVTLSNSTFNENVASEVGSAVMFASLLYVQNRNESLHYTVKDCYFIANRGPGGTFGAGFIHVNFEGTNIFENNTGPGLRVVGSLIGASGVLNFTSNDARNTEGGALYISAFGQVKLYLGVEVNFVNNYGRIGSAIVVNVQRSSVVFSELVFNPQCFLIHENSTLPPEEWGDVTVRFLGNEATVGPAVYISHLNLCSWFSVSNEGGNGSNRINAKFEIANFTDWPVFQYSEGSNTASSQADKTSKRYYFQTEAIRMRSANSSLTNDSKFLEIYPGQMQKLNLEGVDQLGNPTYIIVRLSDSRANINSGAFSQAGDSSTEETTDPDIIRFEPALLPIQPSDDVVTISYGFPGITHGNQFHIGETIEIIADAPYNVRDSERFSFELRFAGCRPGYVLRRRVEGDNLLTCSCEDGDFDVLTCDDENDVIVLRDGLWAAPEQHPSAHLHVYPCPVPYCSCHRLGSPTCDTLFYQNDPNMDQQCHATRRGTLCGECINGTSVGVLRTNCRECSTENYYALGFLVIADIVIPALILFTSVRFRFTFPHSLKGLLFYVQTVYYVTEYFPAAFWDIRQYMLYFGSALGLYFPWDFCLYPGMDALVSFALRFIPSLTAAVVVGVALIAVFRFFKSQRRKARKRIWLGVWSLVLLLYAPLTYTCVMLLNCPNIPSASGEDEAPRWFLDGSVKCFKDPLHTVLGVVAILVLLVLVLLIPALFFFILLGKSHRIQKYQNAECLYEALTEGYRDTMRWWGAWDLLRRLLLVVIIISLPGRSVATLYIIIPAFTFHLFLLPYEKLWQNLIEAAVLTIYILLLLLRSTQTFLDNIADYSGTSIPAERGTQLARNDGLTWFFFPFYYLPVFGGIVYCVGQAVNRIVRMYRERMLRPRSDSFEVVDDPGRFGDTAVITRSTVTYTEAAFN